MNNKAALFDLDGVLIDTEGIYSEFWSAMGTKYGLDGPAFAKKIKGTTLQSILNDNFPAKDHEAIVAELEDFEENMRYRLFPGVLEFLNSLHSHGIKAAVVTSSGDMKMSRLWQQHPGLKEAFSAIVTDSSVERSKPDPQGYLIAAELCGAKPEDCWVFEDSYNGLLAGRRSGAAVIGLSTTNPAEALQGKADAIIPSLEGYTVEEMLVVRRC